MIISTHRLTKLNDRLTIWERIPLLISAHAREDDAEYRQLFSTSAIRSSQFSEHLLAEQARICALGIFGNAARDSNRDLESTLRSGGPLLNNGRPLVSIQ